MSSDVFSLIDKLEAAHSLTTDEYQRLVEAYKDDGLASYAAKKADAARRKVYGTDVFVRGLVEVGNVCKNDCLYCGIRRSNQNCDHYVLTEKQILSCCKNGYAMGFKTFVLQGGEGAFSSEKVCDIVSKIRNNHPDCAITLSLGEFLTEEYRKMYDVGANRYLLRHETADEQHYKKLHPPTMSFDNRMRCLNELRQIGFATGCGFMVGSPFQTSATLAKDLKFVEEFSPEMCGIGPFVPQKDTPFKSFPAGSAKLTIFLLSLLRLIKPNLLLPATTALGTILKGGREAGIAAGANVVMPNISPPAARKKYTIYDNKLATGAESAEGLNALKASVEAIGYNLNISAIGNPVL